MSVISGLGGPIFQQPQVYRLPEEAPPAATQVLNQDGVQHQDVRTAVDQTISSNATPDQRQDAYSALQGYVDRAAQGGDYEVIDDTSMQLLAIHALRRESIPMVYDTRVLDAVDLEIAPTASEAQRLSAYDTVQTYVDTIGGINDVGITTEALPDRTATLLEESCFPTLTAAVRADADQILKTGVRDNWLPGNQEDDYGARFNALTDAMSGQSEDYQAHLVDAVLKADPGALKSWMTIDNIVSARDSGVITGSAFSSIGESVAEAYNNGAIDSDSFEGMYDIDPIYDQIVDSDHLLQFLNASSGPETLQLRATLAETILNTWNVSPYPTDSGFGSTNLEQLSLAIEVASGDSNSPGILTNLLKGQDTQTLTKIYAIAGQLPNAEPDLMATIYSTVALDKTSGGAEIAIELARLPGEHSDWFDQKQIKRCEGLAAILNTHSEAVLGALSEYDDSGARGLGSETDRKQYELNGRDLAAVLEITIFNPEISEDSRAIAQDAILDYVGEQSAIINRSLSDPTSAGYLEASGRLVVLAAASDVAVDRGFEALQADRDAQKAAIVFLVDLALSANPTTSLIKDQVKDAFLDNSLVSKAMEGITGKIVDTATGHLTTEAKEQLLQNLDNDSELIALIERQGVADSFRSSVLSALSDERDRAGIQRDADGLTDDISELD